MNEAMPSLKSSVACTILSIAGIAAIAAGSFSSRATRALAIVWRKRGRRALQHLAGELDRPLALLARFDDLLHQPDAVRLVGAELVGEEQVVHRVAPTGPLHVAHGRPAERGEAPLGLELAHPQVRGGHDDVAAERDLDADRERDPLQRGDPRLGQAPPEAERVHRRRRLGGAPLGGGLLGLVGEEQRHLQSRRRVVAGERQHADEQVGVLVEARSARLPARR